jgi:hypothetical protein
MGEGRGGPSRAPPRTLSTAARNWLGWNPAGIQMEPLVGTRWLPALRNKNRWQASGTTPPPLSLRALSASPRPAHSSARRRTTRRPGGGGVFRRQQRGCAEKRRFQSGGGRGSGRERTRRLRMLSLRRAGGTAQCAARGARGVAAGNCLCLRASLFLFKWRGVRGAECAASELSLSEGLPLLI